MMNEIDNFAKESKMISRIDREAGKANIVIIVAIIIITFLMAAVIYLLFIQDKKPGGMQKIQTTVEETLIDPFPSFGAKDYIKDYALFELGVLVGHPAGVDRFFQVVAQLEYRQADRKLPDELRNKLPMMKDSLMRYFGSRTIEEFRNMENIDVFKEDIMRMINAMLLEGRITDVLFEQIIVQ